MLPSSTSLSVAIKLSKPFKFCAWVGNVFHWCASNSHKQHLKLLQFMLLYLGAYLFLFSEFNQDNDRSWNYAYEI